MNEKALKNEQPCEIFFFRGILHTLYVFILFSIFVSAPNEKLFPEFLENENGLWYSLQKTPLFSLPQNLNE